ncbi:MAG TPA: alpha-glucuronidase family glycosyl hydrolase [Chitinophagaceae bacterium]|nr:alpha-glucuronidase family glycosyl hydrolase [Chitinophagaceae bacterium]
MKKILSLAILLITVCYSFAEDGYRLWLRYDKIDNATLLQQYRNYINAIVINGSSPTLTAARNELLAGLQGLLDKKISEAKEIKTGSIVLQTKPAGQASRPETGVNYDELGKEGFAIVSFKGNTKNVIVITANTDIGILYGVFHFLRLIQTQQPVNSLKIVSVPKIQLRILDHWDNLNRTVERGYAGASIWNWHTLPGYIDKRYIDYARANASIGINGTVLTNVNANAQILTPNYLEKVAALANTFRPYGIKVYLTARFSAPVEIGGLKTADPLNEEVKAWWKRKVDTIYQYVPDFGGFLVKANSEGQPGPQNYQRTHADGANMLADAVASHGGIVMWRAFVYSNETPTDRVKQAYDEFKPLDGQFRKNVLIQVKNGPLDFQPREPFHPLFGAMPQTPLMMEFQITMEYLGQGTHLVYEAPMFKECLDADTYARGKGLPTEQAGSTVAKVIDGSIDNYALTGIAGVSNIGNERNWTSQPFLQANWYAFGRLAWDHGLSSSQVADEWIRQTFTNNKIFLTSVKGMMLSSRQTMVNYMTPLGLHHIMGTGHHYGPAPWVSNAGRADWNPVYYHKADSIGIGFNRTVSGSDALSQYTKQAADQWKDMESCPDDYLLWFHHVPWNHRMKSGRTLWDELCYRYNAGVDSVRRMQGSWEKMKGLIDDERFQQTKMFLSIQEKDAVWWRNACLLYFQTFSRMAIPAQYEKPDHTLEYYKGLRFQYAPGNGNNL